MENIQLSDLIYEYCRTNQKYLVHYKLNYKNLEERENIIKFYEGKINDVYFYTMKNQDEGFFVCDNNSFEDETQLSFPTDVEIFGEYGEDSPLFVFISIYDKTGICVWQNSEM